jgi:hypothetical protein
MDTRIATKLAAMLFMFTGLIVTLVVLSVYLFDKLPSQIKPSAQQAKSIAYIMFLISLVAFVAVATRDLNNPVWLFAFLVTLILFISMSIILRIVLTGIQLPSIETLPIFTLVIYLIACVAIITVISTLYTSFFQV